MMARNENTVWISFWRNSVELAVFCLTFGPCFCSMFFEYPAAQSCTQFLVLTEAFPLFHLSLASLVQNLSMKILFVSLAILACCARGCWAFGPGTPGGPGGPGPMNPGPALGLSPMSPMSPTPSPTMFSGPFMGPEMQAAFVASMVPSVASIVASTINPSLYDNGGQINPGGGIPTAQYPYQSGYNGGYNAGYNSGYNPVSPAAALYSPYQGGYSNNVYPGANVYAQNPYLVNTATPPFSSSPSSVPMYAYGSPAGYGRPAFQGQPYQAVQQPQPQGFPPL